MQGKNAVVELFNIKDDPTELINLADNKPEKVKEMANIYFSESKDFPPPMVWKKQK